MSTTTHASRKPRAAPKTAPSIRSMNARPAACISLASKTPNSSSTKTVPMKMTRNAVAYLAEGLLMTAGNQSANGTVKWNAAQIAPSHDSSDITSRVSPRQMLMTTEMKTTTSSA